MLQPIKNLVFTSIVDHLKTLFYRFDPVEDLDPHHGHGMHFKHSYGPNSDSPVNGHLIWVPFIQVATLIWGIVGFQVQSDGRMDLKSLATSRYIFMHQMVLPELWSMCDVAMLFNVLTTIIIFTIFAFKRINENCYRMRYDGRNLCHCSISIDFLIKNFY